MLFREMKRVIKVGNKDVNQKLAEDWQLLAVLPGDQSFAAGGTPIPTGMYVLGKAAAPGEGE